MGSCAHMLALPTKGHERMLALGTDGYADSLGRVSKSNIKGRPLWNRSLAPSIRCAISALITVLSTVFKKKKWAMVGNILCGFRSPETAEGLASAPTNVRLDKCPGGYFMQAGLPE